MSHILTAAERSEADKFRQPHAVYVCQELIELRNQLEARNSEVIELERKMAAMRLHGENGWQRYESANKDRNALRAEMAKAVADQSA